jgi:hypothetical protein
MTTKSTKFEELAAMNVNEHTKSKQGLTYLSWSWAWEVFKRHHPDATYNVWRHPETHLPYSYDENLGFMVYTEICAGGEYLSMWLPVMDGANKAQKAHDYTYHVKAGEREVKAATMFDINSTIMRCFVKNIAMFGLGLYIYEGDKVPKAEVDAQVAEAVKNSKISLNAAAKYGTETLTQAWGDTDNSVRGVIAAEDAEWWEALKAQAAEFDQ